MAESPRAIAQRAVAESDSYATPNNSERMIMARALVEIDRVIAPYVDATCGRTFANTLADNLAAILDGTSTAQEG